MHRGSSDTYGLDTCPEERAHVFRVPIDRSQPRTWRQSYFLEWLRQGTDDDVVFLICAGCDELERRAHSEQPQRAS